MNRFASADWTVKRPEGARSGCGDEMRPTGEFADWTGIQHSGSLEVDG
jgi:hypothetical protein